MTVTLTVPAEVVTRPDEAALPHGIEGVGGSPVRRMPSGWSRGLHDPLRHQHARPVTGFVLVSARAEA